ncbi:ORF1203 [White spot syndrome virus]|uniref:ORF1203 n=1 Tax=White spot syndrome virus TaxID=342409 RepID=A0A2D3I6M0_9VIRU|nr:ORF1203 [White spot syndrome virus]
MKVITYIFFTIPSKVSSKRENAVPLVVTLLTVSDMSDVVWDRILSTICLIFSSEDDSTFLSRNVFSLS